MTVITWGVVLILLYLIGMFAIVEYKGDTSIANFTWGGGVLLVAWYTFFTMSSFLSRQIIVTAMISIWASRLIVYVYKRYSGKDPRFTSWKWQGIKAFIINASWIFGQSIMIAIMSSPIVLINRSTVSGITYLDMLGVIAWVFGYCYESLADYQLSTFLHDSRNKGRVLQSGLWHYSRHPNYFGEIVMWWSIYLIALSVPLGWATIIAPATITFLLLCVTGVPLLENAMANNPEYQVYKKKTSMIIPWFSK